MNASLSKFRYSAFIFFLMAFLVGCQNNQSHIKEDIVNVDGLYLDDTFSTYQNYAIETEKEIFLLDDNMRLMVEEKLKPIHDVRKRAVMLVKQIFDKDNVALSYSSGANVSARNAYYNQEANCLSLTIMAYALAKEADLHVNFQEVNIPEYWVRNGENNMLSGHVNLSIKKLKSPNQMFAASSNILTIDFDSAIVKRSFPTEIINKNKVLAMFYSNKGGQALFDKQYDKAYAYFKTATKVDPNFSSAWGNLGILYRIMKHEDHALKSYRYAIKLDNENYNALSNMNIILSSQGKYDEVKSNKKFLYKKRNENPYYHALLADEAFENGDNNQALSHYRQAIILARSVHEFHFGLAKVYYAMQEFELAEKSLKKAIVYSRNKAINNRYIAKLDRLKQTN